MLYRFQIAEKRFVESANLCRWPVPYVHPTRIMEVHDLIYLLEGEWEICIGSETYLLQKDTVVILPAGMRHFGKLPCKKNTKNLYIHLYPHKADGLASDDASDSDQRIVLNNFIDVRQHPHIKRLFERVIACNGQEEIINAYVVTLLYELSSLSSKTTSTDLAQQIRDYVISVQHIPTNEEIASHFSISKRKAEECFKKKYRTTIHRYILLHKLEKSKEYLQAYPNMKLSNIAHALGFCDEYHFSRSFKKEFGIRPGKFKRI